MFWALFSPLGPLPSASMLEMKPCTAPLGAVVELCSCALCWLYLDPAVHRVLWMTVTWVLCPLPPLLLSASAPKLLEILKAGPSWVPPSPVHSSGTHRGTCLSLIMSLSPSHFTSRPAPDLPVVYAHAASRHTQLHSVFLFQEPKHHQHENRDTAAPHSNGTESSTETRKPQEQHC